MEKILVSIVVLAYNQEQLILDALRSTLYQEYAPLELLICDDFSTDSTLNICQTFIEEYRGAFENVSLLPNKQNIGIAKNLQGGLDNSKGILIKPLAGDNLLVPGAIKKAVEYYLNTKSTVFFGKVINFEKKGNRFSVTDCEPNRNNRVFYSLPADKQFRVLCVKCCVYEPGVFYHRSVVPALDLSGLGVRHIEDWPKWLKFTRNGNTLTYGDFEAVYYRKHRPKYYDKEHQLTVKNDINIIIDKVIMGNKGTLNLSEIWAVKLNKRIQELSSCKANRFKILLLNELFNLLRFFTRARMLYWRSLFCRRVRCEKTLDLPFKISS